jgi:hypothetical protein
MWHPFTGLRNASEKGNPVHILAGLIPHQNKEVTVVAENNFIL